MHDLRIDSNSRDLLRCRPNDPARPARRPRPAPASPTTQRAAVPSTQRILKLEAATPTIAQYGKLELRIAAPASDGNPYDPDEIDITIELTSPSGRSLSLPAFYFQDFERRPMPRRGDLNNWLYPTGLPQWLARFAPTEVGAWSCRAVYRDWLGSLQSNRISFQCTPAAAKGFLRLSRTDPRFFQFDDGSSFFAIGHNLAFVKDAYLMEDMFARMGQSGGNYTRMWACSSDWAMCLEGPKSAWSRSYAGAAPIALLPGRPGIDDDRKCIRLSSDDRTTATPTPSHPVALRPGTRYTVSGTFRSSGAASLLVQTRSGTLGDAIKASVDRRGQRQPTRFAREFTTGAAQLWLEPLTLRLSGEGTLYITELSLKEAGGGPELLWEADVNRRVLGSYNTNDCFILDKIVEAAERDGIYIQLVVLMRDLYWEKGRGVGADPDSLQYELATRQARKLLRYAVARWGYSTHIAMWEYFNEIDPGAPTDRFYQAMGEYLEQIDIYHHLRGTSTWGPSPKDWPHPKLDVANLHPYMRNVDTESWKDEALFIYQKGKKALDTTPNKPVLMSEFGLADSRFGLSPYMKQDIGLQHIHYSLWASALSGLAGTTMSWWWEDLHEMDVYQHFPALSAFLADVPFATAHFQRIVELEDQPLRRVLGLQGRDCAYLWIANPKANWYTQSIEKATFAPTTGATVRLEKLQQGDYRIQWWDTRSGKVIGEARATASDGTISLNVPTFTTDVACKIMRASNQ